MRAEHRIVIAEDDATIAQDLATTLRKEGFEVDVAADYGQFSSILDSLSLALVSSKFGNRSANDILRRLRFEPRLRRIPVVVLAEKDDEIDRVVAFELGADDYVVKPLSVRELSLRLRAILRRTWPVAQKRVGPVKRRIGPIVVDATNHDVRVDGRRVRLTTLELRLIDHLAKAPGRVFTREELVEDVWKQPKESVTRVVDTAVKRLRRKLGARGRFVQTIRGVGYRLREGSELLLEPQSDVSRSGSRA
jgi:two-component system phosphate regulon response regulator PhoB